MLNQNPSNKTQFVLLVGLEERNRFFSPWKVGDSDPTKLSNGAVAYHVLGYTETVEQAQIALYGRSYT